MRAARDHAGASLWCKRVEENINSRRNLYPDITIKEHIIFDEGYKKFEKILETCKYDFPEIEMFKEKVK